MTAPKHPAPAAPSLVIFDCDGTIVDSQHLIVTAMSRAFEAEHLVPPERGRILSIVGLSLPLAVERLMDDGDPLRVLTISEGYKAQFGLLRRDPTHYEPVFEGIEAAIHELAARPDFVLGIATGKSRRGVDALLERTGLGDRFVTIQTADDHPSKPHPSMIARALAEAGADASRCVMIGDTTYDMEMAVAAGVRALGVSWGYHSVAELEATGATAIADHGATLPAHVDALLAANRAEGDRR